MRLIDDIVYNNYKGAKTMELEKFLKSKGIRVKGITGAMLYVYPINKVGILYCKKNFHEGRNCYFFNYINFMKG